MPGAGSEEPSEGVQCAAAYEKSRVWKNACGVLLVDAVAEVADGGLGRGVEVGRGGGRAGAARRAEGGLGLGGEALDPGDAVVAGGEVQGGVPPDLLAPRVLVRRQQRRGLREQPVPLQRLRRVRGRVEDRGG